MPYIQNSIRNRLDPHIDNLYTAIVNEARDSMDSAGMVNYCFTRIMVNVMDNVAPVFGKPNYAIFALFEGVLNHISKEVYRRLVSKYEDGKIQESGDLTELSKYDRVEE